MNLLVFVFTLIFILGSLSYLRLSNFVEFTLLRKEWTNLMEVQERDELQKKALNAYEQTHVGSKNGKNNAKAAANAQLNIRWLTQSKNRESDKGKASLELLRNLIFVLFSDYPFFIKAQNERPDFISEIVEGLNDPKDIAGKEVKLKKPSDLSQIVWKDNEIREIFYAMIKDTVIQVQNDQEGVSIQKESLLNYLIANKNPDIRLYLAPRKLLIAIFGTPQMADELIAFREKLYSEDHEPQSAKQEFEENFKGRIREEFQPLMNFEVSKTNPGKYRVPT